MNFLPIATMCVGGWMVVNGVLHDIFVLRSEHGKLYDRNLLRLLMDGHILITCGLMLVIAGFGIQKNEHSAYYIAGLASLSVLIYCAMIFPFLKSIVTIILNLIILVLLVVKYQ